MALELLDIEFGAFARTGPDDGFSVPVDAEREGFGFLLRVAEDSLKDERDKPYEIDGIVEDDDMPGPVESIDGAGFRLRAGGGLRLGWGRGGHEDLVFGHDPDVAEAHRVSVVLEVDRSGFGTFAEGSGGGGVIGFDVFVDEDPVVPDGEARVGRLFAVCSKLRRGEVDVVGLPGKRGETHVHSGFSHGVDAAAFVVETGETEGVEDLDFITALSVESAVAALLATGFRSERRAKFYVEVEGLKQRFADSAFPEQAVFGDAGSVFPLIEIFPVEEDDGVLGWTVTERWALPFDATEDACVFLLSLGPDHETVFGVEPGLPIAGGKGDRFAGPGSLPVAGGRGFSPTFARQAAWVEADGEFAVAFGDEMGPVGFAVDFTEVFALDGEVGIAGGVLSRRWAWQGDDERGARGGDHCSGMDEGSKRHHRKWVRVGMRKTG